MSNYRVAVGHDIALVSLAPINPQPSAGGVKPTERTYGLSGAVFEQGQYGVIEWSMLESESQYTAILTAFGLSSSLNADVTVYIRNEKFAYARYNAVAQRPQIGQDGDWTNFFLRGFRIVLTHLVAL